MKYLFTIFIITFFLSFGYCQNTEKRPPKLNELAETAEMNGDYYTAIYYYELSHKLKQNKRVVNKLSLLYYKIREYEKAKTTFLKIAQSSRKKALSYFYIGLSYKQMGQYDSCIYYLDKCSKEELNENQEFILKREYKGALIAIETPDDTTTVRIYHLNSSINGSHMESAPNFINDSLIIYTSQVINDSNLYVSNDTITVPTSQFFYAKKETSIWLKTNNIINLNQQFVNVGNSCFSLDKKRFYFTATIKNWHKKNISQLYICQFEKGQFINPVKLDNNINGVFFSSTQPTVGTTFNPDFEIVYFSSDMPNGKGGMDIWYTVFNKKRGTFGKPINAGSRINTPLNEITPYYDYTTKTLNFSSNGQIGFGGYDIYKSIGELKSWTKPTNIGNYINSNADEIYFTLNNSRNAGFIVSNRPVNKTLPNNYCCFDLFYFTFKNPNQLILKGNLLTKINPIIEKILKNGVEFRDSTIKNSYLSDAIVSLYLKTDIGTDSLYITSDTTDNNGFFKFDTGKDQDYTLIIHKNEEIKALVNVSTQNLNNKNLCEIVLDIEPIEALPNAPMVIKNIYYEFGKSDLNKDSKSHLDSTLVKLMKELTDIKIEISSHTDNVGDSEYNVILSEKRAKKVAAYLESKGISKKRLITKGYGESYPISQNQNSDNSDNIKGMERNRRTEFKIIGKVQNFVGF